MNKNKVVEWFGETECDICHKDCGNDLYDANTTLGGWATMCKQCYSKYGLGLGIGQGQHYHKTEDGHYIKKGG